MGWWRIDPATGKPLEGATSALSRSPDFVLLNAVPGVDADAKACYLGDGPSDMVSTLPAEIAAIVGPSVPWSADQVRELFLQTQGTPDVGAKKRSQLRAVVKAFWEDIDGCYEDAWDRPAHPSEKRWICEEVVDRLLSCGT